MWWTHKNCSFISLMHSVDWCTSASLNLSALRVHLFCGHNYQFAYWQSAELPDGLLCVRSTKCAYNQVAVCIKNIPFFVNHDNYKIIIAFYCCYCRCCRWLFAFYLFRHTYSSMESVLSFNYDGISDFFLRSPVQRSDSDSQWNMSACAFYSKFCFFFLFRFHIVLDVLFMCKIVHCTK